MIKLHLIILILISLIFHNCSNEKAGEQVINEFNVYKSELIKYNKALSEIITAKLANQNIKNSLFELYKTNLRYQKRINEIFKKPLSVNEKDYNEIEKLKTEIKTLIGEHSKLRLQVIKIKGMENFFENAILKSENEGS